MTGTNPHPVVATNSTYPHTCANGMPCAACEIVKVQATLDKVKTAIYMLNSDEFVKFVKAMSPRCPNWQRLIEKGPSLKDVGGFAATFVKVKSAE